MKIQEFKDLFQGIQAAGTSMAFLIGAIWALRKFSVFAEEHPSLTVKVTAAIYPSPSNDFRIIAARAEVLNTGKVPCQIDLKASNFMVNQIDIKLTDNGGINVEWLGPNYFSRTLADASAFDFFNVPVGGTMNFTEFVAVPVSNTYRVGMRFAIGTRQGGYLARKMQIKTSGALFWEDAVFVSVALNQ